MVKILLALAGVVQSKRVALCELAGAGLLVAGAGDWLGRPAAAITGGVLVLAKSFEWDMSDGPKVDE